MGSYAIAEDYCQEALATVRAARDDHLADELLYLRAWVLLRQEQQHSALPLIEAGLDLARHLGEPHLTARLLSARAHATSVAGDHAGAVRVAAEAVWLFRQAGDRLQVGQVLGNLGYYELSAGNLDAARRHLTESLDIFRALGHHDGTACQTLNLGLAEYLSGSPGPAGALFAESLHLARRTGTKALMACALIGLALTDPGTIAEPLQARLAGPSRQRLRAAMDAEALDAGHATDRTPGPGGRLTAPGPADTADGQPQAAVPGEAVTVLTARELDVLKLVAQGLTNPGIAQRLFLSQHTVHRHLANILRKLGLSSRAAAAAWGVRTGLA